MPVRTYPCHLLHPHLAGSAVEPLEHSGIAIRCGCPMRRKHTAVETEILGVAARIISERGYQGTTLDDIAAAANISRSTFYSYFASKEELLHRIYRQVISTTQAAVARMAGEDRPAPEKLRRIIRYLISYLAAHTSLMQVFFSEHLNLSGTTGRAVRQANRTFIETIARVFEEGGQTGTLTPLHPKRFSYILLGICNWMHRWYRPGGEWTPEVIAEEVITLLESGYLPQERESHPDILLGEVRALRREVAQLRAAVVTPVGRALAPSGGNAGPRQRSRLRAR